MPSITIMTIPIPMLYMVWPRQQLAAPPAVELPVGYTLRHYRDEDADAYCDLVNIDGWEDAGWRCNEKTLHLLLVRALPASFFLVEAGDGTLVATALARHRPDADSYDFPFGGELSLVFVHPEHRRRGLGRAVTAAVTARLIEIGYQNIYLNVMDERLPAIRLYLELGFVPFLYEDGMSETWQEICCDLGWPATVQQWPRTLTDEREAL